MSPLERGPQDLSSGLPPLPPPNRRQSVVMLGVMIVLFVALLSILIGNYGKFARGEMDVPPGATASKPASRTASGPSRDEQLPSEVGAAARNLEFAGNLAPLGEADGKELGMDDVVHRIAVDVARADAGSFSERVTQLPPLADLLARPGDFRGRRFRIRCIPAEVNPWSNDVTAGRVRSWRVYAGLQRDPGREFVVFESLEDPGHNSWTLDRDVLEVDAVFVRTATYMAGTGAKAAR